MLGVMGEPLAVELSQRPLADATVERVSRMFWALANPTRVRILHALAHEDMCNAELAGMLNLTESAVSHQMRDLRLLNMVVVQRQGRHTIYRLADEHVRHVLLDALWHAREPEAGMGR